ncbi:MAG: arginine--tRNA ligase [Lachnospiraceae bacterium]|jgi:arginyl-tRNA synthetase|nr:arginine--tRNA ligase [Lachnospiraceae bacterium]
MEPLLSKLEAPVKEAFKKAGYDESYAKVTLSNRPDLCEYQCNGALSAAKQYHKAPFMIADDVVKNLDKAYFSKAEVVKPGFINLDVSEEGLALFINEMKKSERFGVETPEDASRGKVIIDYGGANVAKPLHVGHLRSAVIGESIKRIASYLGYDIVGDVHLGDWGLQIGLIITELKARHPELVYFDDSYTGEYPEEAPFTMSDLEEIYPYANAYSKEHEDYKKQAQENTRLLQEGKPGYLAIWKHVIDVSVADLKRIYDSLDVHFELWKKESDAQKYIPDMVKYLKDNGYAHEDQGALVVDVQEETDTKTIPPCMILKSNGATLYNTTDLATMIERRKLFDPARIIYVVDKRQELYFTQVFRCARKTKILDEKVKLNFVGFGTMNGKDNKPFKTRDGGVLRLEALIKDVKDKVLEKMQDRDMETADREATADRIALAAIKYGDLSNQPVKDYIFDIDRFTSFEGNTGPYILYTMVRIKSLMEKAAAEGIDVDALSGMDIKATGNAQEKSVYLTLVKWIETIPASFEEFAPNRICQFLYELCENYNGFYHDNKILTNDDSSQKMTWLALSLFVLKVLDQGIDLLGLKAPDRM